MMGNFFGLAQTCEASSTTIRSSGEDRYLVLSLPLLPYLSQLSPLSFSGPLRCSVAKTRDSLHHYPASTKTDIMADTKVYRASTTAPVNIAVVKYVP